MNWSQICERLDGPRLRIWEWLNLFGKATTSELAEVLEMNLLTVRPRMTELYQMGFVDCVGRDGREGIYEALPMVAAEAKHEKLAAAQLDLEL